ncbi:hypothetical protein [Nonomuraea guangzhouensis]|uniref:Uncharacterized protein n=1 Tax=Nonomuraea guangzhouensis TaxID=1291555 RepID=A0ABW4GGZ5_9ACTN|nr:hypothetical protein [Nonomuraea guangzhouensis]
MSDPLAMRAFFVRCKENVDKVAFTFADGREFLGWVAEVTDDDVLVTWAPSPIYAQATGDGHWNPEDERVPFALIQTGSAASYDSSTRRWVNHVD